jgi:hypothetical protein
MPLNEDYPAGFEILTRLFGAQFIEAQNERMNEIHWHKKKHNVSIGKKA